MLYVGTAAICWNKHPGGTDFSSLPLLISSSVVSAPHSRQLEVNSPSDVSSHLPCHLVCGRLSSQSVIQQALDLGVPTVTLRWSLQSTWRSRSRILEAGEPPGPAGHAYTRLPSCLPSLHCITGPHGPSLTRPVDTCGHYSGPELSLCSLPVGNGAAYVLALLEKNM